MGYDVTRFVPETVEADQLACPICLEIFDHPVELPECQHVFCLNCIRKWLHGKRECPLDRTPVKSSGCTLRHPSKDLRTKMDRLRIRCLFWDGGCRETLSLGQMEKHQRYCNHKKKSKFANEGRDSSSCNGSRNEYCDRAPEDSSHGRQHRQGGQDDQNFVLLAVIFIVVLVFTALRHR